MSIRDKKSEFEAVVNYTEPDIIFRTESWLKGVKPGENPTKDAIKSSEIFPSDYLHYRNDRGTLFGGVFILVHKSIISIEQPELATDCEIEWVKIKLQKYKDLFIGCFYMPHRNLKDTQELDKSIKKRNEKNNKNLILVDDFNCPDINWNTLSVDPESDNRDIQQSIVNISLTSELTQVHDQPTRGKKILDLIFTANPSLIKSSISIPGISDHDIVATDIETKSHYQKTNPRKCYIYSKANWKDLNNDLQKLSSEIETMYDTGSNTQTLWDTFRYEIKQTFERPYTIKNGEI